MEKESARMNKKGFTLIEVMVVLLIVGILMGLIFPNIHRARIQSNHTFAKATLKSMSMALESYYMVNSRYPSDLNKLVTDFPPYMRTDYFVGEHKGYTYVGESSLNTYLVTATPTSNNKGIKTFTLETGGVIK